MLLEKFFGLRRGLRLDGVFAYNNPVSDPKLFYPRDIIYREFAGAIDEPGTQILVYGEPRVGKTSLVIYCLEKLKKKFLRVQCSQGLDEEVLVRKILDSLGQRRLSRITAQKTSAGHLRIGGIDGAHETSCEQTVDAWIQTPSIPDLVDGIIKSEVVLFVDDIERALASNIIEYFGDLAKAVSDNSVRRPVGKLVLSLAATSSSQIPECMRSSGNRVRMIKVPRMSDQEIEGLIRQGMIFSCLKLSKDTIYEIIRLSEGIPAIAKLLCLEAGRAVAESVGVQDQRLFGNEPEVTLDWFHDKILPSLQARGLL